MLEPINHPCLEITGMKNASLYSGKVAPGMEIQFLLKFAPEEEIDYTYNLVCVTEREKFLLPIKAYGARGEKSCRNSFYFVSYLPLLGILDFPDNITFSDCPVKFLTTKTLFVRNIGNRFAKFKIEVESPFEAIPNNGFLDVKGNMQIDVNFNPEVTISRVTRMLFPNLKF
jgi:hydrocephalus-inducing protein